MITHQQAQLAKTFKKSTLDFIEVEIRTGSNFADLGINSRNANRRERDRANARRAYDPALSFLRKHDGTSTEEEKARVHNGLASLKSLLVDLGDKFEEEE